MLKKNKNKGETEMTYEEIVQTAKDILLKKDVSGFEGHLAVQVDVTGEGEGAFYIELKDGQLFVEPYDYVDRDCRLIASADTLTKLVTNKLDAVLAFTTGKLKVEGSIDKALEFQKICKAKDKKAAAKKPAAKKSDTKTTEKKPAAKTAEKKAPAKKSTAKTADKK